MSDDRHALLESIAFGADPATRPADRLRALELLTAMGAYAESESEQPLSEAERWELLEAFGMPAAIAVAKGPEYVMPPTEGGNAEVVIRKQAHRVEELEAQVAELEAALRHTGNTRENGDRAC